MTTDIPRQELTGHTSPETAYLVADYPYGFRLRTEIRYWIETKKGHGQRVMSQTRNPKKADRPWNTPKSSAYSAVKVLWRDPAGYVESDGLSGYSSAEAITAFQVHYPRTCAEPRNAQAIAYLLAAIRAHARVTWTVTTSESADVLRRNREACGFCAALQQTNPGEWCEAHQDTPRQTLTEQTDILRKLTILELQKMKGDSA